MSSYLKGVDEFTDIPLSMKRRMFSRVLSKISAGLAAALATAFGNLVIFILIIKIFFVEKIGSKIIYQFLIL